MNFDQVKAALEKRGYAVSSFEAAKDAADYLAQQINGVSVSFGGLHVSWSFWLFINAFGNESTKAPGIA